MMLSAIMKNNNSIVQKMQIVENKTDNLVTTNNTQTLELDQSGHKQEHFRNASSRHKRHLHVASEVIVRDGTIITTSPPITMALAGHAVWVSCMDGSVEVRNARTAELVKRLVEPSEVAEKTNSNGEQNTTHTNTHVFGNFINNYAPTQSSVLVNELPHRVITVVHATNGNQNTYDNNNSSNGDKAMKMEIWLGDNHDTIEICDGDNFQHLCSFAAHTGSVTCMCDFGGMLYTGSCSIINDSKINGHEHGVLNSNGNGSAWNVYLNSNDNNITTKEGDVEDDLIEGILQWDIHERSVRRVLIHSEITKRKYPNSYTDTSNDTIGRSSHNVNQASNRKRLRGVCVLYAEGNILVSGYHNGVIRVWNVADGSELLHGYFHVNSGPVIGLCRMGQIMWSADVTGMIVRWKLQTCEMVESVNVGKSVALQAMCKVGNRVYVSLCDNSLYILGTTSSSKKNFTPKTTTKTTGYGAISVIARLTNNTLTDAIASNSDALILHRLLCERLSINHHNHRVMCTQELSRFVIWSADSKGNVRCWYQDEIIPLTDDVMRFNDMQWYKSNSTPYKELKLALQQHNNKLYHRIHNKLADPSLSEKDKKMLETLLRACKSPNATKALQPLQHHLHDELQRLRDSSTNNANKLKGNEDKLAASGQTIKSLQDKLAAMMNDLRALSPTEAERLSKEFANQYTQFTRDPHNISLTWQTSDNVVPSPSSAVFTPVNLTSANVPMSSLAVPSSSSAATLSSALVPPSLPPSQFSWMPPPLPAAAVGTVPSQSSITAANTITLSDNKETPSQTLQGSVTTKEGHNGHDKQHNNATEPTDNELTDRRKWHGMIWTNPNVGNYIRRRYYGATPSLRAPDLERQERRRRRLPEIKVEPRTSSLSRRSKSTHLAQ